MAAGYETLLTPLPFRNLTPVRERFPAANASKTLLWIDANTISPGNRVIEQSARRLGINVHMFSHWGEAEAFMNNNRNLAKLTEKHFRIMSNMVVLAAGPGLRDEYDAGFKRAEAFRMHWAVHCPIMIFCGSPERAAAERAYLTGTIVTKDEKMALCFATFGPVHGLGCCEAALVPNPNHGEARFIARPIANGAHAFCVNRGDYSITHDSAASRVFRYVEDYLRNCIDFPTGESPDGFSSICVNTVTFYDSPDKVKSFLDKCHSMEADGTLRMLVSGKGLPSAIELATPGMPEFPTTSPTLMWHCVPEEYEDVFMQHGQRRYLSDPAILRLPWDLRRAFHFSTIPSFFLPVPKSAAGTAGPMTRRIFLSWVIPHRPGHLPQHMLQQVTTQTNVFCAFDSGADLLIVPDDQVMPMFIVDVTLPIGRAPGK